MRGRNVINHEAIDEFIALSACPRRSLPLDLALKALRRPLRNEEALYSPVGVRPDNAPPWITREHIASGELCAFDFARCDYAMMIDIQHVMRWLQHGHLRKDMSARERRKWEKSLGHIRTLEEAIQSATRQLAAWGERDLRVHRRARNLAMRRRIIKNPAPFAAQLAQGQIVERLRLSCGACWYQLTTPNALAIEAEEMSHCVGSQEYAAQLGRGSAAFYSLRSEDTSLRLTLMVMRGGQFAARGAHNRALAEQDRRCIAQFLRTEKPFGIAAGTAADPVEQKFIRQPKILRRSSVLAQDLTRLHEKLDEQRAQKGCLRVRSGAPGALSMIDRRQADHGRSYAAW